MPDPGFSELPAGRLRLRRFRGADALALAAYRSDPEVARLQGWGESYSLAESERFIASLERAAPGTPGAWFQFAVALADSDELIGDCALRCGRHEPRQAELGFTLARAHQGRGYAREAVARLLDYAFGELGLHRVVSITDERNVAAQRLLDALGFRREGRFVECTWFRGTWATELLYAVLRAEWARR